MTSSERSSLYGRMTIIVGDTRMITLVRELQERGWGRMWIDRKPTPYPNEPWGFDNGAYRDWIAGDSTLTAFADASTVPLRYQTLIWLLFPMLLGGALIALSSATNGCNNSPKSGRGIWPFRMAWRFLTLNRFWGCIQAFFWVGQMNSKRPHPSGVSWQGNTASHSITAGLAFPRGLKTLDFRVLILWIRPLPFWTKNHGNGSRML